MESSSGRTSTQMTCLPLDLSIVLGRGPCQKTLPPFGVRS